MPAGLAHPRFSLSNRELLRMPWRRGIVSALSMCVSAARSSRYGDSDGDSLQSRLIFAKILENRSQNDNGTCSRTRVRHAAMHSVRFRSAGQPLCPLDRLFSCFSVLISISPSDNERNTRHTTPLRTEDDSTHPRRRFACIIKITRSPQPGLRRDEPRRNLRPPRSTIVRKCDFVRMSDWVG